MAKIMLGVDAPQAFIPCDPEAGYEAEVDWGTAKAIIAGESVRLKFFCMRSKYSGKHFVRFYSCRVPKDMRRNHPGVAIRTIFHYVGGMSANNFVDSETSQWMSSVMRSEDRTFRRRWRGLLFQ